MVHVGHTYLLSLLLLQELLCPHRLACPAASTENANASSVLVIPQESCDSDALQINIAPLQLSLLQ